MAKRGRRKGKVQLKTLSMLLAAMLVILALWQTILIYPLKILVVFFHELSHGLMAVLTGGKIVSIEMSPLIGGLCITQGGNRFLTLSAGYLGSLLWGGAVLLIGMRTRHWRSALGGLGGLLILVALVFIRNWFGFGFAVLVGAALLFAAIKFSERFSRVALVLIGLTSCLYVIADIFYDTVIRSGAQSDAGQLAAMTHIPTIVWGLGWTLTALVVAGWFVVSASRKSSV